MQAFDLSWPVLNVIIGLLSWKIFLLGILIEWPFVGLVTKASWSFTLALTFYNKLVSTLFGVVTLFFLRALWEVSTYFLRMSYPGLLGWLEYYSQGISFAVAVSILTLLEVWSLNLIARTPIFTEKDLPTPQKTHSLIAFGIANCIILGITFTYLIPQN